MDFIYDMDVWICGFHIIPTSLRYNIILSMIILFINFP